MVFLDRIFLDDIFVFVRLEVPLGPVLSFYSRWCQTQKKQKQKGKVTPNSCLYRRNRL